jgi:hypothetical protein
VVTPVRAGSWWNVVQSAAAEARADVDAEGGAVTGAVDIDGVAMADPSADAVPDEPVGALAGALVLHPASRAASPRPTTPTAIPRLRDMRAR